jgi:hypothetical protein
VIRRSVVSFQGLTIARYCLMLDRLQEALIAANDRERRGELG